jgi:hypothetical protein
MVFDAHDPAFAFFRGRVHAPYLRQHEDRGGNDLHRQATPTRSPLLANVQSLPSKTGRLHTGFRLEKGEVENQVGLVRERFLTP